MSIITDLHDAIIAEITDKVAGIQTSGFYPKLRTSVAVPAVFVDLASIEPGDDLGTGQLSLIARFEARVIVADKEGSELQVRELAAEVARIIHCNNFGLQTTPAKLVGLSSDGFSPELDAYDVWVVEWEHEFQLGESIWDGVGVIPETVYIGYTPRIGAAFEEDYTILDGELPA